MKKHYFRSVIATASLVLGLGGSGPAHTNIFGGFLGAAAAGTTDAYSVTCPIGTIRICTEISCRIDIVREEEMRAYSSTCRTHV